MQERTVNEEVRTGGHTLLRLFVCASVFVCARVCVCLCERRSPAIYQENGLEETAADTFKQKKVKVAICGESTTLISIPVYDRARLRLQT